MVRPLDSGDRTEAELRAMIPRYSDMVPALEAMARGFEVSFASFDLNIGNLPYCIAPKLAKYIHHDGEHTLTVSIDDEVLGQPWDKYDVKRRDKHKPASCGTCAIEASCSGVFDTYRAFHGVDELEPISRARLAEIDPDGKVHVPATALPPAALPDIPRERMARTIAVRIERLRRAFPFGALSWGGVAVSEGGQRAEVSFDGPHGERIALWLAETAGRPAGGYRLDAGEATPAVRDGLRAILDALRVRPALLDRS
jgi:hypothetical protein